MFFWILQITIWLLAVTLSNIPGVIMGCVAEVAFSRFWYWPGHIFGCLICLVVLSPILFLKKDIPVMPGKKTARRGSLFPFLFGMWLGSKIDDD